MLRGVGGLPRPLAGRVEGGKLVVPEAHRLLQPPDPERELPGLRQNGRDRCVLPRAQ